MLTSNANMTMRKTIVATLACLLLAGGAAQAQLNVNRIVKKAKQAVSSTASQVKTKVKDAVDDSGKPLSKVENAVATGIQKTKQAVMNVDETTVNGHNYTSLGDFKPEQYDRTATGCVSFSHVPTSYEECDSLYTRFLGTSAQGAASMMVMALAIYERDPALSERCIRLIATPQCAQQVLEACSSGLPAYQAAACLKGAGQANGYRPNTPYTVEFNASDRVNVKTGDSYTLYIDLNSKGWQEHRRTVAVCKTPHSLYKVQDCESLVAPCLKPQAGTSTAPLQ